MDGMHSHGKIVRHTGWNLVRPFLCPLGSESYPVCDCGYEGPWEHRVVTRRTRGASSDRYFFEERCPQCHDVEAWETDRMFDHGPMPDPDYVHVPPRADVLTFRHGM